MKVIKLHIQEVKKTPNKITMETKYTNIKKRFFIWYNKIPDRNMDLHKNMKSFSNSKNKVKYQRFLKVLISLRDN